MTTSETASGLRAIVEHASEYELEALLRSLFSLGFDWDSLRFEGVRELSPSRGPLVRGVRVEEHPMLLCVVQLDTGLLAATSPLPDYFRDFAQRLPDPDDFIDFLGFWDSVLLRAMAYASFPTLGAGRSRALQHGYRARLGLGSPMALHWVFRGLFPELSVEVQHAVFRTRARTERARVGSRLDGRLVIGAEFGERRAGYRVSLCAESAACEGVADWEAEALTRLARVEALLARTGKPLEVVLRFENYVHGHTLVDAGSARRQLGVRPWLRPVRGEALGPGDVVVRSAVA